MDNRLSGLIVVSTSLFFLWLYDTGKWTNVKNAITGQTGPGPQRTSYFGSVPGATPTGANGGGQDWQYAACNAWPEACPFLGSGGGGAGGIGGGGILAGGISSAIGGIIGGIFGL